MKPEMTETKPEKSSQEASDNETVLLEWTCHPVKRRPTVSIAVTLLITLIGVSVLYWADSQFFAVLAMIVVFASLAKFYFPTSYKLTETHIHVKTTTQKVHREWGVFRSSYRDKNGILLSPFTEPSRLENFRGQYLMFNDNGDEVTSVVKEQIAKHHEETAS